MRNKIKGYRYKIIEYTYNKDGVRICSTIHLFNSRLKYILLIIYFKIKNVEWEVI